jgi:sugar/nucleoside kinase (ribokinase family)
MSIKVFCIGDLMLDVVAQIPTSPHELHLGNDTRTIISTHGGGAGGNVAAWLRIAGAQSHMLARIGKDAAGVAVRSEFDRLGVSYSEIDVDGAPTGIVVVIVDKDGGIFATGIDLFFKTKQMDKATQSGRKRKFWGR